ncbi:MAG TPA: preprotein translocase subunit YajC [bacterium]
MWTGIAFADNGASQGQQQPSIFDFLLPVVIIFLVFYFVVLRPQQKRVRVQKDFLSKLKSGDEIVTASGIHGKIVSITDDIATIEIANNVRIKIERSSIAAEAKVQKKA